MPCDNGIFILSLDCEGKWGMADHIGPYHETYFTTQNIERAYTQILGVLKQYRLPASFAFVSAFTQSPEEFKRHKDVFFDTPESYKPWLAKFYRDMEAAQYEGWFCPAPYKMVADAGLHDVGSHSCFHRPFVETELTREEAEYDFRATQQLLADKPKPQTFIYPRNQIGFTELLPRYGFIGYRHGTAYTKNTIGRFANLAQEFHVLQQAEAHMKQPNNLGIVPAGFFLNWPHGLRKHVPDAVTQWRWHHLLQDAIKQKKVAHMWFHPHNFINHPAMLHNFEWIMEKVARYREQGKLTVMTMRDYIANQRKL